LCCRVSDQVIFHTHAKMADLETRPDHASNFVEEAMSLLLLLLSSIEALASRKSPTPATDKGAKICRSEIKITRS